MGLSELPAHEQRGSRPRCILLTDGSSDVVAERLTRLVAPFASIDPERHVWMPNGMASRAEARLGEAEGLLHAEHRQALVDWWLAVRHGANTPNWDIAATATIEGREGLVLIEAKAHRSELGNGGHKIGNEANLARIRSAVEEANLALRSTNSSWCLSCDSHYQLANRFAWSWKLASLGVPVVLVYLGFLNATEMREPFDTDAAWKSAVREHARGVVPDATWDQATDVNGTPLRAVIRAVDWPLELVSE